MVQFGMARGADHKDIVGAEVTDGLVCKLFDMVRLYILSTGRSVKGWDAADLAVASDDIDQVPTRPRWPVEHTCSSPTD